MKYCAFIWDGLGRFLCYRDIWWDTWGSEEVGAPDIWMRRQHCREDDGMCRGPGMGECKWGSWQQLRGEVSGGKWGQGGGQRKCQWDGALVRILALTLNEIGHHWRGLRMEGKELANLVKNMKLVQENLRQNYTLQLNWLSQDSETGTATNTKCFFTSSICFLCIWENNIYILLSTLL